MKAIRLSPETRSAALAACRAALRRDGGVILIPTETVYGLACRWDDAAARERIRRMKGRDPEKPLQMLAPDLDTALAVGLVDDVRLRRLAQRFCPGPLTIVQKARAGGTIGVRVPDHPFALELLREIRQPLAATSANRSGEPSATVFAEAVANLASPPDLAVDGGTIPASGQASTVVDISVTPWRILRQGPVGEAELREALERGSNR